MASLSDNARKEISNVAHGLSPGESQGITVIRNDAEDEVEELTVTRSKVNSDVVVRSKLKRSVSDLCAPHKAAEFICDILKGIPLPFVGNTAAACAKAGSALYKAWKRKHNDPSCSKAFRRLTKPIYLAVKMGRKHREYRQRRKAANRLRYPGY